MTQHRDPIHGFLLCRQWRDRPSGITLTLWVVSNLGPIEVVIEGERAVLFVEQHALIDAEHLAERRAVSLKRLHGAKVDALYFRQQRLRDHWLSQGNNKQHACEADINPAERYLMERFIRADLRISGGRRTDAAHIQIKNPKITAAPAQSVDLRCASIDIETSGIDEAATLFSIGLSCGTDQTVLIKGDGQPQHSEGLSVQFYPDDLALLHAMIDWFQKQDPDLVIGWNVIDFDLHFLIHRAQKLGITLKIGRAGQASTHRNGPGRHTMIPGRVTLDGPEQLRAAFWQFPDFSLQNVTDTLLGESKTITEHGQDKVETIVQLAQNDPITLARYNIQDCQLVTRIFQHTELIDFLIAKARQTGLALGRLGGSVAAFDYLYLPRLHRRGVVAPSLAQVPDGQNSPGGYVLDSTPGLYEDILVFDFKSLYPSIIRTFCIDPLGLDQPGDDAVPGFRGARFSRHQHILPAVIGELWAARDDAKLRSDQPLSQALKIIMNSFYGVLGARGCRFFDPRLAASITLRGHEIITQSRDWFERAGYSVIYGDTDSLFVRVEDADPAAIGRHLAQALNTFWQERLSQTMGLPSYLEIQFETHYQRFFMPTLRDAEHGSKKRYAGVVGRGAQSQLVFKGLESVRSDWTPLAREFQRELYRRVFAEQPFTDYVRHIHGALFRGELDAKLVYRKRLRRPLDAYQRNRPPQVQAALQQDNPGRYVDYVISLHGPVPIEKCENRLNYDHYAQRQLAPVADALLRFLGTSYAELTDAQLRLF